MTEIGSRMFSDAWDNRLLNIRISARYRLRPRPLYLLFYHYYYSPEKRGRGEKGVRESFFGVGVPQ
jgi:hypothetical protein